MWWWSTTFQLVVALLFCFGVLQAIGYRSLLVKSLVYKSILPIDIILLELKRMKCLKLLRKNDNPFKDKLIASFKNPKLYPSPLQNFYKRGTRMLSYLTGVVETVRHFCKSFTNIKSVGTKQPPTDINSGDRKTLLINFVTKQLNDMKGSAIVIFTDDNRFRS